MENMAEKLGLGNEVRQLKIGQSFTDPKSSAFHSIKYDFKPASVDTNKIATVDVANNHQVTVTVPHLDGAGVPQTVFKGSQRLYQKECVLIIDRVTGEMTLEKLACNIQVKKTRSESTKLPLSQGASNEQQQQQRSNLLLSRSQTPPIGQRMSNKTKVTSGSRRPDRQITHLVPKHSPLHASPNYPSPGHHNNNNNKSPKRDNHENHNPSTLASLPMIGVDDFDAPPPPPQPLPSSSSSSTTTTILQQQIAPTLNEKSPNFNLLEANDDDDGDNRSHNHQNRDNHLDIGEITDTSSSSSDSDSDTDPDNTVIDKHKFNHNNSNINNNSGNNNNNNRIQQNGHTNNSENTQKLPTHLLNEDLCLSESGSDSD